MNRRIRKPRKQETATPFPPIQDDAMQLSPTVAQHGVNEVPPIVQEVLSSSGQPLDADTQSFMESGFGHDFSQIRVHTDERAVESAQAVNALAYTVGRDVVFGTGQYKPGTTEGKSLLAHELTHVVQQEVTSPTIQRQPTTQPQVQVAQTEWEKHSNIKARYTTWQKYETVRNLVASWTAPHVDDPASYIDAAIKEWKDNPHMHNAFGNNLDGNPHRSYLNLRRLYQKRGIGDPAQYLATNIVGLTFYNRHTSGHKDLKKVLQEAETAMTEDEHVFILGPGTWSYVPRTYNDNINKLSNHALGKAIDIDPGDNPHIKSHKDIRVINAVCGKEILPQGLLAEKNFTTLKKASDYFRTHFTDKWVTDQEQLLSQMQSQHPHPKDLNTQKQLVEAIHSRRSKLDKYAASGFLNLPEELVEGLKKVGLAWGGEWDTAKDFMHFELQNP